MKNRKEIDKLLTKLNIIPAVDLVKFGNKKMTNKR